MNSLSGYRKKLYDKDVWLNIPIVTAIMFFPNFRDIIAKWGHDDPNNANRKTGPIGHAGMYNGSPDLNPDRCKGRVLEEYVL